MARITKLTLPGRLARPLMLWIAAAISGAALTLVALLLFYLSGGLARVAPPIALESSQLQLISGQGAQTPAGLEISQPGSQGLTAIQGLVRGARADRYRHFSWRISGLEPGRELRLIWATFEQPKVKQERVLPPTGPDGGVLDLSAEPGWQGRIVAIGLVVRGPLAQPLLVRGLELQSKPLTTVELLRQMMQDWITFEDWSQRSINYYAGSSLDALFPPVVVMALWVGFSTVLYALFTLPRCAANGVMPYAALFLLGWLALDLRWQWDLGQRLTQTLRSFAGKDETARRLAALDGDFYRFLLEIRRHLPEQPARLLIVSNNPGGFLAGRARYHLLPHNGYAGLAQLPTQSEARAGDYVLILAPLNEVRYDRERQLLERAGAQLSAEMLYAAAAGALFRVRGG